MTDSQDTPEKREINWKAIEAEYRMAKASNRELADKYGVNEKTIRDRAKRYGWKRDLVQAVEDRTAEKMIETAGGARKSDLAGAVEEAATERVKTIRSHLARLARLKHLSEKYIDLLEEYLSGDAERMQPAIISLFPTKGDSLQNAMRAVTAIAADIQKLERQSLGMDDKAKVELSGPGGKAISEPDLDLSKLDANELLALSGILGKLGKARPTAGSDQG